MKVLLQATFLKGPRQTSISSLNLVFLVLRLLSLDQGVRLKVLERSEASQISQRLSSLKKYRNSESAINEAVELIKALFQVRKFCAMETMKSTRDEEEELPY